MKYEILEPLLLDRALGALSPEVAALLDAHLARDPSAARRAADLAATLALARAATAAPVESPRRPLDLARLRQARPAAHSATRHAEIFRLAACLALGLGLGWLARVPAPRAGAATAAAAPRPAPELAPPGDVTAPSRFWSVARLIAAERARAASGNRGESRRDLHWNSPTKLPHAEGKL